MDFGDRIPVAECIAPSFCPLATRFLVDHLTRGQDRGLSPRVPVLGRNEVKRAVQVLRGVSCHEVHRPAARGLEIGEGLARILGTVLQRSEERLREWVVVAHTRATE